jgi:hypothetical protein
MPAEHVEQSEQGLREYMRDYNHWYTIGVLCELLPRAENRVTLAGETDRFVVEDSLMLTQGSANPALMIMALASRLAERLDAKRVDTGVASRREQIRVQR